MKFPCVKHANTKIQIYKYTNTQIYKYANTDLHRPSYQRESGLHPLVSGVRLVDDNSGPDTLSLAQ